MNVNKFINPWILQLKSIDWGKSVPQRGIRLNFGENPIAFEPALQAIRAEASNVNRYPEVDKSKEYHLLADYCGVKPDQVIMTNAGDDAIEMIARVFLGPGDMALAVIPSYPCYAAATEVVGASLVTMELGAQFQLDVSALIETAKRNKAKVIWIANPNNPTGNLLLDLAQIGQIARSVDAMLILDEAYFEFSEFSAVGLINNNPNLVIVRTFSKAYGLAGLSFGYLLGNQETIQCMRHLQDGPQIFSVNRLARAAARAVLENPNAAQAFVDSFKSAKRHMEMGLAQIPGIEVLPGVTSFSVLRLTTMTASQFKNKLAQQAIFIKDLSIYNGVKDNLIYMGIPALNDQQTVLREIKSILEGK